MIIGSLDEKEHKIQKFFKLIGFSSYIHLWRGKSIENDFIVIRHTFGSHFWSSAPLMKKTPKIKNIAMAWISSNKPTFGWKIDLKWFQKDLIWFWYPFLIIGSSRWKRRKYKICGLIAVFSTLIVIRSYWWKPFQKWKF